ncbi:hypothetical protein [Desulfocurvus sp. DL9XJH121]
MKPEDLDKIPAADLALHLRTAFSTSSGQVLLAVLRRHCFMEPRGVKVAGNQEQINTRYGRMTLFLTLEEIMNHQPKE